MILLVNSTPDKSPADIIAEEQRNALAEKTGDADVQAIQADNVNKA